MIETPRRLKVRLRDFWGSLYDQEIDVFGLDMIAASLVRTSFARTFPEDILKRVKEGQRVADAFNSWRSEVERAVYGAIYSDSRVKTPPSGFSACLWNSERFDPRNDFSRAIERIRRRLYDLPDLGDGLIYPDFNRIASGGSFQLKFLGATTDPLRYDATQEEIDDAVNRARANIIDEAPRHPTYDEIGPLMEKWTDAHFDKTFVTLENGNTITTLRPKKKGTENETNI